MSLRFGICVFTENFQIFPDFSLNRLKIGKTDNLEFVLSNYSYASIEPEIIDKGYVYQMHTV